MRLYYFDDSGSRTANVNQPYFVFAGFGIDSKELTPLQTTVKSIASKYGVELQYPCELKASHAGNMSKPEKNWMVQSGLEEIYQRRALLLHVLRGIRTFESLKCITIALSNESYKPHKAKKCKMDSEAPRSAIVDAVRIAMERVEMDLQDNSDTGCVFLDEERGHESGLRDEFRYGSDFVKRKSIIETPAFVPSEESIGVQIADIIAGGVSRWLNSNDPGYARHIWPKFRTYRGEVLGAGLKVIPPRAIAAPNPTMDWTGIDARILQEMYKREDVKLRWSNGLPIDTCGNLVQFP